MKHLFFTGFLVVVILGVLVYAVISAQKRMQRTTAGEITIPEFRIVGVKFEIPEKSVVIENSRKCTAHNRVPCKLNDVITFMDCQELSVKCYHFKENTKFIENGKEYEIPKNETKNDGYLLPINKEANCNIYHGNLVLISISPNETEYLMMCECKNPGYVNKTSLLGACDDAQICDGHVKDINKPVEKIECICRKGEINKVYENEKVPTCKPMTVQEANKEYADWTSLVLWNSNRLLRLKNFHPSIHTAVHVKHLLDPCASSLNDSTIPIQNGYFDPSLGTCRFSDFGIPVHRGIFDDSRIQNESRCSIDGALATTIYKRIRITDHLTDKMHRQRRRITTIQTSLKTVSKLNNTEITIAIPDNIHFSRTAQLFMSIPKDIYACKCTAGIFTYRCLIERKGHYISNGIPIPIYHSPLLWWWTEWKELEGLNREITAGGHGNGVEINMEKLVTAPLLQFYGVEYGHMYSGLISFNNEAAFELHARAATNY